VKMFDAGKTRMIGLTYGEMPVRTNSGLGLNVPGISMTSIDKFGNSSRFNDVLTRCIIVVAELFGEICSFY